MPDNVGQLAPVTSYDDPADRADESLKASYRRTVERRLTCVTYYPQFLTEIASLRWAEVTVVHKLPTRRLNGQPVGVG